MASLKEFHDDKETRENVQEYLVEFLKQQALDRVFSGGNVSGFMDAKETIDKAFEHLDDLFAPKPRKVERSSR